MKVRVSVESNIQPWQHHRHQPAQYRPVAHVKGVGAVHGPVMASRRMATKVAAGVRMALMSGGAA